MTWFGKKLSITSRQISWLGLWCYSYKTEFGHPLTFLLFGLETENVSNHYMRNMGIFLTNMLSSKLPFFFCSWREKWSIGIWIFRLYVSLLKWIFIFRADTKWLCRTRRNFHLQSWHDFIVVVASLHIIVLNVKQNIYSRFDSLAGIR